MKSINSTAQAMIESLSVCHNINPMEVSSELGYQMDNYQLCRLNY